LHRLIAPALAGAFSFNHLVNADTQRERHREAERLGGLEIEDQLDLCCLLDW
jgi:hypothetical protein